MTTPAESGTRTDSTPAEVVVSGDVTLDWNLAQETLTLDQSSPTTRASWQRGGAALLADLVGAVAAGHDGGAPVTVRPVDAPARPVPPGDHARNHSYATWARLPRVAGRPDTVWRIDRALGVDRARSSEPVDVEWRRLESDLRSADVVVLDDADLGFRNGSTLEVWRTVAATTRPWVVLKQAAPVASGPLFDHLVTSLADRLIVVVAIDDLRRRAIQVSRALSWERTAQDLLWELINKPDVNALSRIAHTIVSFGPVGAAHIADLGAGPTCTLHFDPELVEGDWESAHPGRIMGTTVCLTTAIVRSVLASPAEPGIDRAIQTGIAAGRALHLTGYDQRGPGRMELGFPIQQIVETITDEPQPLATVRVPDPAPAEQPWTILDDRCSRGLTATAADIALEGPEHALVGVPSARFAKLVTVDRGEIEAFRAAAALIADHTAAPGSRPLSIGVFGPPGSGKSFGVKQVAASVAGGLVGDPIEFNLSQLRSPDELIDAFHIVRDQALGGRIPLVFWDEFDTALDGQPLGWLRYFLAPMQDGEFRQGQLTHPIGPSIFVFAGGTSSTIEAFGLDLTPEAFKRSKGPDFVSRLKGYVNVRGPNATPDVAADHHVIRRAILLRSILQRSAPQLFAGRRLRIDPGVLRGFLEIDQYRHGARSMEAIVATSHLSGRTTYERSSLPPSTQLDLHVDAQRFLALVQQPELEGDQLERLASAAHRIYQRSLAVAPPHGADAVDYDDLPDHQKEENRQNVRDIAAKLAHVGCLMVPAHTQELATDFTDDEVEALARLEHERWMRDLGPGWRHGTPTDTATRTHEAYLDWDELDDTQRDKDRNLVRGIPAILAEAGYVMVRHRTAHTPGPG